AIRAKCPFGAASRGPLATWEEFSNRHLKIEFSKTRVCQSNAGFLFNQNAPFGAKTERHKNE
ncbi:MAG TPA: hypothetical protein VFC07_06445, partial [Verrucomicrobiae bacterium]|nr:hypothetical protein [Verrucomicrobiae bacterium]